jgi:hypothetical protein
LGGRKWAVLSIAQYLLDLSIAYLSEVGVPLAHGEEWFGHRETNALVCFRPQPAARLRRSDGNGDDEPFRMSAANVPSRCRHGPACRQAIVDKDYLPVTELERRKTTPVKPLATFYDFRSKSQPERSQSKIGHHDRQQCLTWGFSCYPSQTPFKPFPSHFSDRLPVLLCYKQTI